MEGTLLFNFGIDTIKGTLYNNDSLKIGTIEKPVDLILSDEYAEQNPEQWLSCIKEIINEFQEKNKEIIISSITITYMPGTFVCVDRSGNHIVNAILPCDKRAKYQAHVCYKTYKKQSQDMCIPWDYMTLPRLLWIKYNQPDIYRRIFKVLTPDGYIAYKLCGETGIDGYSATFFGYSPKNSQYNNTIINNMGLDIDTFPKVCKSGECIGVISGYEKEKLNLNTEVKFILSSNAIIPLYHICNNLGENSIVYDAQSSNICFIGRHMRFKKRSGLLSFPLNDDKYMYCMMGSYEVNFLKRVKKMINAETVNNQDYNIGSKGIVVIPYSMGDNTFYNSDMRGSIIGIENGSKYDIITACYEAIGYCLKERIDYLSENGYKINSVEILYDTEDQLFYRIISDITLKSIIINNDEYEKYTYYYTWGKCESIVKEKPQIAPNENLSMKYKHLYNLYKSAYYSISDFFRNRRKTLKKISE